jgi:hypothetical protein
VDDKIVDGDVAYTVILAPAVSSDARFNNVDAPDVSVTNADDDHPTVRLAVIAAGPTVRVYNASTGELIRTFNPYDGYDGPVSVATGDVNGDGTDDIITGPAGFGSGPNVRVFDGATFALTASFYTYEPAYRGGISVAAADVNGDGFADVITGSLAISPHVYVIDGRKMNALRGDGKIIDTGAGSGALASFFAFDPGYGGGVQVGGGDLTGDGRAEAIIGSQGQALILNLAGDVAALPAPVAGLVEVGTVRKADGSFDLAVAAGPGNAPQVRVLDGMTRAELASFFGADPAFLGGVIVA